MSNKLEDEVRAIKHFKMVESSRRGRDVDIDEATEIFVDKYAEKYAEIWYDGIGLEEVRTKLFYAQSD